MSDGTSNFGWSPEKTNFTNDNEEGLSSLEATLLGIGDTNPPGTQHIGSLNPPSYACEGGIANFQSSELPPGDLSYFGLDPCQVDDSSSYFSRLTPSLDSWPLDL